jgi:hypothetical protein
MTVLRASTLTSLSICTTHFNPELVGPLQVLCDYSVNAFLNIVDFGRIFFEYVHKITSGMDVVVAIFFNFSHRTCCKKVI